MANYEFPSKSSSTTTSVNNTTSSPNDENAPVTNATFKQQVESVKKAIKEKRKEEKKETEEEKKEREKREIERKEKLDKIWNNVKSGFSRVTDKVSDLGEEVSSNITQEVFGSGFYANQMNNIFGKTLKGISDSLKKIGSFLATSLGKMWNWMVDAVKKFRKIFSRNGLLGTIKIYFRWMRMKLTNGFTKLWKILESIKLFSLIGGLLKGAGAALKGTVVAAGDLIKSLVTTILGTAAGKALLAGISTLGATLKGVTLASLISAIAKASVLALPLTLSGDDGTRGSIKTIMNDYENGKINEEEYKKQLARYGATPEDAAVKSQHPYDVWYATMDDWHKIYQQGESVWRPMWEEWIKKYPNYMKEKAKAGWFDRDRNDDGIMDNPNEKEFGIIGKGIADAGEGMVLSDKAREELKQKNKLKNTAKVSST